MNASRSTRLATTALAAFFSGLLIPRAFPSVDRSGLYFTYFLVALFTFALLGIGAAISSIVALTTRLTGHTTAFDRASRIFMVCASGLGLAVVSYMAARLLPQSLPATAHLERFDRAKWMDPSASRYTPTRVTSRQAMLGDVIENVLPGRTRAEIEAELGPSLDTGYFRASQRDMIYILGPEQRFMGLDSEWLLIWLDEEGRFRKHRIAYD